MASNLIDARAISAPEVTIERTERTPEVTKGLRLARYCALEEFIGLAFCTTVAYIVLSLASLKP
jgi:hypothetical protein